MQNQQFHDEDFYGICQFAADWFESELNSKKAKHVYSFLKERGINENIIHNWNLGFCPEGKDNDFLHAIESAGFSPGLALTTGLFFHDRKKLRLRSSFAERLIIPKRDLTGKVAGFGARLLSIPSPFVPKYIQSAETSVYSMYSLLFGIDRAAIAIKEKGFAIIAEGYFDVILLQERGIANCVSLIGTRIGKGQVLMLKKHTSRVLIVFDGDGPGIDGSAVVKSVLEKENMEVVVFHLKRGEDPDSILRSEKAEWFKNELMKEWTKYE